MKITPAENETLLESLAATIFLPEYDPATMVTTQALAERTGRSMQYTQRALEALVKEGKLKKIDAVRLPNKRKAAAYVRAEQ